jgi:hypothetical protein
MRIQTVELRPNGGFVGVIVVIGVLPNADSPRHCKSHRMRFLRMISQASPADISGGTSGRLKAQPIDRCALLGGH